MYRLFLVSLVLIVVVACNSKDKSNLPDGAINPSLIDNPITASSEPASSNDKVPVMKFDADTHDFGKIVEGEKVSFAYSFKNIGKAPLIIRAAQGSCGCTVPEYPKDPIAPGEGGIINVTFNSEGKIGHQEKTVTIISNTMPNTNTIYVICEVSDKE